MSDDRPTAAMAIFLHAAMGMPMMMFYAIGILGPQIIADLGISQKDLGWFTASAFGLAPFQNHCLSQDSLLYY